MFPLKSLCIPPCFYMPFGLLIYKYVKAEMRQHKVRLN